MEQLKQKIEALYDFCDENGVTLVALCEDGDKFVLSTHGDAKRQLNLIVNYLQEYMNSKCMPKSVREKVLKGIMEAALDEED